MRRIRLHGVTTHKKTVFCRNETLGAYFRSREVKRGSAVDTVWRNVEKVVLPSLITLFIYLFICLFVCFFVSFFDLNGFKKRNQRNYYNLNTRKTSHSTVNLLTNQHVQYSLVSPESRSF